MSDEARFTLADLGAGLSGVGSARCGHAFCRRLSTVGWAIVRLSEETGADIRLLRDLAREFFAQSDEVKQRVVGDPGGVGGEGVGYRDKASHDSEFLELYLSAAAGATVPHTLTEPPELAACAARVHQRLLDAAQVLLALCAAHVRLPSVALFEALSLGAPSAVAATAGSAGAPDAPTAVSEEAAAATGPAAATVGSTLLRICHYKAAESPSPGRAPVSAEASGGSDPAEALGVADPAVLFLPHTDSTLLTLSPLCPNAPGLQLAARGGGWLDVERSAGVHDACDVEVHAGDFLGALSRGVFVAMRHRVVRPAGGGSRISCPLLLRPRESWRRDRGWLKYTERDDESSSSDADEPS